MSRPLGSVWIEGVEFLVTEPARPRPVTPEAAERRGVRSA